MSDVADMLVYRYTDRVTITGGRYVIGFNATALVDTPSAAIAIDDVILLEGSCDIQGSTAVHCVFTSGLNMLQQLAFKHNSKHIVLIMSLTDVSVK